MVDILYLFDKGVETWACFRYNGRIYSRKCEHRFGAYHFTFKRKLYSCFAQRQPDERL